MVMYRDFAQRKAKRLGLSGTVKNMPDGSVTLIAEGEESILLKYIELLKTGPVLSRVNDVAVSWKESTGEFDNKFKILF